MHEDVGLEFISLGFDLIPHVLNYVSSSLEGTLL
jgi:hypothetical protein